MTLTHIAAHPNPNKHSHTCLCIRMSMWAIQSLYIMYVKLHVIKGITWKWYSLLLSHLSSYGKVLHALFFILYIWKVKALHIIRFGKANQKNKHTERGKTERALRIMAIDLVILILDRYITSSFNSPVFVYCVVHVPAYRFHIDITLPIVIMSLCLSLL